jgi:hypothetical protein
MSKYKVYTVYKADGTKIPLYGTGIGNALDNAGYDLDYVTENIRDYREGMDNSLEFINGKWHEKIKPEIKVKIDNYEFNAN